LGVVGALTGKFDILLSLSARILIAKPIFGTTLPLELEVVVMNFELLGVKF